MLGVGKDRFVWGSGWICQEQRSFFKKMSKSRVGNKMNGVAREREDKEPHGPGVPGTQHKGGAYRGLCMRDGLGRALKRRC